MSLPLPPRVGLRLRRAALLLTGPAAGPRAALPGGARQLLHCDHRPGSLRPGSAAEATTWIIVQGRAAGSWACRSCRGLSGTCRSSGTGTSPGWPPACPGCP